MKKKKKDDYERLSKQEYDILYELNKEPFINQRILSEQSGHSLGVVNRSLKKLISEGYLDDYAQLTDQAREIFKSRAPQNAIILAAGFSARMVPINTVTPKALLEVHGEKLIDRLIKQLKEVGVKDITIVVGFMKDCFEYLIDEYGVKLVYAANYASMNNLHSLAIVADKICNSYILPCDVWCYKNPFHRYELYSWYMVNELVDENSDVRVNRKMELVKVSTNASGNGMIGISYLVKDDAEVVKQKIKELINNPAYNDKFWEEALYTDDRMIVQAKIVHSSDIVEINTYEQLRDLDSNSNQLKHDALQTISTVLSCRYKDIVDINVLKKGVMNCSFFFRINKGDTADKYIMRIPNERAGRLIDWSAEELVYNEIRGCGFCDDLVYIDPINGYKIVRFINNVRCCDPYNEDDLRQCMKLLRSFHNTRKGNENLKVPHTFNLFERVDFFEKLWGSNPSVYRDYQQTKENCQKLIPFIDKHKEPNQLTHIDAVPDNFLFDSKGRLQLIDWEYAGMQDKHVDIAMFGIHAMYSKEQIDHLIDVYFEEEGGCDKTTRAKIYAYISVCGLIWSNWCEYNRNYGVEFGEYSLFQYRFSKDYYRYAVELMNEIGEPIINNKA